MLGRNRPRSSMFNTGIDVRQRGEEGFREKFKFLHPPTVPPSSSAVGQAPHSPRKVFSREGAVGDFFLAFGWWKPVSVRSPVWFLPLSPTRVNPSASIAPNNWGDPKK